MLNIYIVRHGQNEDNANGILNGHRDLPLTEIGLGQAHELAEGIKDENLLFDAIYSSPLLRASQTAEIICATLGAPGPIILDSLIERDLGVMTGKPISDIQKLPASNVIKTDLITYFISAEAAETFQELLARAGRALEDIKSKHSEGSILLVSHGDFGKMLYASFYGLGWMDMLTKFHFGNCELLLLSEGADPAKPHVLRIEQHNH